MKKKSPKLLHFIEGLNECIQMQSHLLDTTFISSKIGVRDIIGKLVNDYLEKYFLDYGFKNTGAKANDALYWEGKEPEDDQYKFPVFGETNSPELIINDPYSIAILYKQSINASDLKEGIAESLIYTLSGEFDFVYFLFHDKTSDKKIERSIDYKLESSIVAEIWDDHNVCIKII